MIKKRPLFFIFVTITQNPAGILNNMYRKILCKPQYVDMCDFDSPFLSHCIICSYQKFLFPFMWLGYFGYFFGYFRFCGSADPHKYCVSTKKS